jgi:hypothetical protein
MIAVIAIISLVCMSRLPETRTADLDRIAG